MIKEIVSKRQIDVEPLPLSIDKKLTKRNIKPFPNTSFLMMVSGSPGSGKSTMICSMVCGRRRRVRDKTTGRKKLIDAQVYRKVFDRVFLMIPETSLQSISERHPFRRHERVYTDISIDILDDIEEQCKEVKEDGEYSLLVIDDFGALLKRRAIQEKLQDILTRHRHLHLSIIFATQFLIQLPLDLRKLIPYYIIYRPKSKKEIDSFMSEINIMSKPEYEAVFQYVYDKKHNFLFLNMKDGTMYKNNNRIILDDINIEDQHNANEKTEENEIEHIKEEHKKKKRKKKKRKRKKHHEEIK